MNEKKWYNYIIFDNLSRKTYIGSTVNLTRRFRQHNQEIKGGAKYTRGGQWVPYLVLYDIAHTKSSALSYEWHLKNSSKKINGSACIKRKKGLENYLKTKTLIKSLTYTHVIFVNSLYRRLTPLVNSNVLIIYLKSEEFNSENLDHWVKLIQNINLIKSFQY